MSLVIGANYGQLQAIMSLYDHLRDILDRLFGFWEVLEAGKHLYSEQTTEIHQNYYLYRYAYTRLHPHHVGLVPR